MASHKGSVDHKHREMKDESLSRFSSGPKGTKFLFQEHKYPEAIFRDPLQSVSLPGALCPPAQNIRCDNYFKQKTRPAAIWVSSKYKIMPRLSLTLKGPETKSTKGHCLTGKSRARPAHNSPTKCTLVQNCTCKNSTLPQPMAAIHQETGGWFKGAHQKSFSMQVNKRKHNTSTQATPHGNRARGHITGGS